MDLKNKKQELSELLAQLTAAGTYDALISLAQRVMILATELKIVEQLEAQMDSKIKELMAQESAQLKELIKQIPVQSIEAVKVEVAPIVVEEKPQVMAPLVEEEMVIAKAPEPAPVVTPVRSASISEKLQTADVSIAAKLSKSGIKDLTKALSINQKMLFTKELFKGDSFAFNEAIGKLNAFESKNDAMAFLNIELAPKYAYKTESESYLQFVELIERRYA